MNPIFEAVHSDADSSLRCLRFSCRRFSDDHTWHYHPEYELAYVVASEGPLFVGDSIQPYLPGDLLLLGPNLPHCWDDEPRGIQAGAPPELVVIQFNENSFGAGFLTLAETDAIRKLLRLAVLGVRFDGPTAHCAGELMRAAVDQTGLSRLLRTVEVLDVLARSRTATILATQGYCSALNDPINRHRMDVIHRYVRDNLTGDLSQAQIARTVGLGPSTFSRFFKAATGVTFVSFVNTLRINEACRRLHDFSTPVTEIALMCGYNNMSNFNRQFAALKGINPSLYRQRLRRKLEHHSHYIETHARH